MKENQKEAEALANTAGASNDLGSAHVRKGKESPKL
jgi:hypothetical protein